MSDHLVLDDVSISFNGFKAINGLNLQVDQGELRCLVGPNGAGKTTALDLICGKIHPSSGRVAYKDHDISHVDDFAIARIGVGRKFQIPSVFKQLSVRENLEVAKCKQTGVFKNFTSWKNHDKEAIEELCQFVGLSEYLDAPADYLSHGQTQWLEIALLLAQDAELILLDEPTAGMTGQETQKTAQIVQELKGKHTIIVVEHDMGFVKEIGDKISVMHQGKMLAEGTVSEIENDKRVRDVYLGSAGISDADSQ